LSVTPGTRAALVTGASSGIGLAAARMLGSEGYALTMVARRPDKLAAAADLLRQHGMDVYDIAVDLTGEDAIQGVVAEHRERWGRLDVLMNNAGVGLSQSIAGLGTRQVDLQLSLNLRAIPLFYRECMDMLEAAAAEHSNAHVWNTASVTGKYAEAMLSVYSATKFGVIGFTQAANRELARRGIRSCAICPAWVDTEMTDFLKEKMPGDKMIQPDDIAALLRTLLYLSPGALVPELLITQLNGGLGTR
jgi:NAD(P)-dependent dehydrogenase (short-subunit alcohol dehydrogenase family)